MPEYVHFLYFCCFKYRNFISPSTQSMSTTSGFLGSTTLWWILLWRNYWISYFLTSCWFVCGGFRPTVCLLFNVSKRREKHHKTPQVKPQTDSCRCATSLQPSPTHLLHVVLVHVQYRPIVFQSDFHLALRQRAGLRLHHGGWKHKGTPGRR